MMIYDDTACALGEGPLWHPVRQELFWFDILKKRLHRKGQIWQFDSFVSAAGWIDRDHLLIASDTALMRFNIETGKHEHICPLEADNPITRSNDGRADSWGGFWIGTMGLNAEPKAGAIYRYYNGELRRLLGDVTIPNAICFSYDRAFAFYTDTAVAIVWRQSLDQQGWPSGPPEMFLDLRHGKINPDGAVCDREGGFWNAQWGAGRLVRYLPDGTEDQVIDLPATQVTCPAFGGPSFSTIYVTSAFIGLNERHEHDGKTFALDTNVTGFKEHQVVLASSVTKCSRA